MHAKGLPYIAPTELAQIIDECATYLQSCNREDILARASLLLHNCVFDSGWYATMAGVEHDSISGALIHFLLSGERDHISPMPLFEISFYLMQAPEAADHPTGVVGHYLEVGWLHDLRPHPLFDVFYYKEQLRRAGVLNQCHLSHFIKIGSLSHFKVHPLFDDNFYLKSNPDVARENFHPLLHYLRHGWREQRSPHPLFDVHFYRAQVAFGEIAEPISHYITVGHKQGLSPHPAFEPSTYTQELQKWQQQSYQYDDIFLPGTFEIKDSLPGESCGRNTEKPLASRKEAPAFKAGRHVYCFTSICLNYLPKAMVLASTLKAYAPHVKFVLLLSDIIPEDLRCNISPIFDELIEARSLGIPNFEAWAFSHSIVELCTAVKGPCLRSLLERNDCEAVLYFDPDMAIFDSLEPVLEQLQQASILLTPHLTAPETSIEGIQDNELCALKHGVYNLGFIGVRPTAEGLRFAKWWEARLLHFCRADIPAGLFTDQRWIDLVPGFFREVAIMRHSGCNVATWNLSHRLIEGDSVAGFTVNGEPLIFYHFSGFDSGAQEVMLGKYGSKMPAAHLLRQWYIDTCQSFENPQLEACRWVYGYFENGVPITSEQRLLYRDRIDVQQAFPQPFRTKDPLNSFLQWYAHEENRSGLLQSSADLPPLYHFILAGWREGLRPNMIFDPLFYCSSYGISQNDINPLEHYLAEGVERGYWPAKDFDPNYYSALYNVPPEKALCDYLANKEDGTRRRTSAIFNFELDKYKIDALLRWRRAHSVAILFISHFGGGGTEKHLNDLASSLRSKAGFLSLAPHSGGGISLRVLDEYLDLSLLFSEDPLSIGQLEQVLLRLQLSRIHVHHLLGNIQVTRRLLAALDLPYDFSIHDYYNLCPNPFLTDTEGRYVGEDLENDWEILTLSPIKKDEVMPRQKWQARTLQILQKAERIIFPSWDCLHRFQRIMGPLKQAIMARHPENYPLSVPITPQLTSIGEPLRIVLLGDLLMHKGLRVVEKLAALIHQKKLPLQLTLLGSPAENHNLRYGEGIIWTGVYQEIHLEALLAHHNPNIIWFASSCPETYSYTLSAALRTGLPVVVPNLGAFPERVQGRGWSWIENWELCPEEWTAFFLKIRSEHFVTGLPPKVAPVSYSSAEPFYENAYLSIVKNTFASALDGSNTGVESAREVTIQASDLNESQTVLTLPPKDCHPLLSSCANL